MSAIMNYINGSLEELRHVQWSTRRQAVRLSIIVIIFIAISASFFAFADSLMTQLLRFTIPG